jgi:dynein heavy chain, axonemal
VKPKEQKQKELSEKLRVAEEAVAIKKDELGVIKAEIDKMESEYNQLMEYIQQLSDDKIKCERRLTNAGKLIGLLGDEGERWQISVGLMENEIEKLIGNVFIAAASISYIGPFTGFYREILVEYWI